MIPTDGERISTEQLARQFFRGERTPLNARVMVSNLVRRLVTKTQRMPGHPKVKRSKAQGPKSLQVWIER